MREKTAFENAAACLPPDMRQALLAVPGEMRDRAEEIRLRAGFPPTLLDSRGEVPIAFRSVTSRDLDTLLETASGASAHSALAQVASGFITMKGGGRIGLCGDAAVEGGSVKGLRRLHSASLRLPRQVTGCADSVLPALMDGGFSDTLIISPPGGGKTTFLRELTRRLSDSGSRIALADERGEVAGAYDGAFAFDVGRHTDVMTGAPKHEAVMMLVRAMNPEILAMDEITSPADLEALALAAGCGVTLLATAHGTGLDALRERPLYRRLLELGIFKRLVTIRRSGAGRIYEAGELDA